MRKLFHRAIAALFTVVLAAVLTNGLSFAQGAAKKSFTFHGKVVSVSKDTKALTVDGQEVKGWMGAMTMSYKIDNPSIIDSLKPGDLITATVYDGDYVLHNVKLDDSKTKK